MTRASIERRKQVVRKGCMAVRDRKDRENRIGTARHFRSAMRRWKGRVRGYWNRRPIVLTEE